MALRQSFNGKSRDFDWLVPARIGSAPVRKWQWTGSVPAPARRVLARTGSEWRRRSSAAGLPHGRLCCLTRREDSASPSHDSSGWDLARGGHMSMAVAPAPRIIGCRFDGRSKMDTEQYVTRRVHDFEPPGTARNRLQPRGTAGEPRGTAASASRRFRSHRVRCVLRPLARGCPQQVRA